MRVARLLPSVGVFALLVCPLVAQPDQPPPKPNDPVKPQEPKKEDPKPAEPKKDPQADLDKKALEGAGLKADDAEGLVKYLKARTLNDTDMGKITALIEKMNADAPFDERVAAQEELLKLGGQTVDVLKKKAKESSDPEIQYRAKDTLRKIQQDKQFGTEVTAAVVRALGKLKSEEAATALFAFLPLADGPQLVDLIQEAVTANAGKDGKPAKVLVDALTDTDVVKRRVAAVALVSGGTAEQRVRFKDVYPKVVALAKEDKDAALRFDVTKVLLVECREKEAVGVLIDLLPNMTRGQSWQAEELLTQLAGKDAPKERCKHVRDQNNPTRELATSKKAREACRDAWKKWWEGASAKADLGKADLKLTVKGELVVVTQTWAGQQQGVITEYGADEKEKRRTAFTSPNGNLFDVVVREDGKVLSMDYNVNQIQVRDGSGKVTATWTVQDKNARNVGFQPKGMDLLPDGHLVAVHANGFTEFDKDGKAVLTYARPEVAKNQPKNDLAAVTKMKNGEWVLAVMNPNQNNGDLITLDEKGKEIADRKAVKTGYPNYRNTLVQTGDSTVLLFEPNNARAQEYDLKTGKATGVKWDNVGSPMSVQKLPNGNLLYPDTNVYPPRLVERSPDGQEVWTMPSSDRNGNTQFLRAYAPFAVYGTHSRSTLYTRTLSRGWSRPRIGKDPPYRFGMVCPLSASNQTNSAASSSSMSSRGSFWSGGYGR